MYILVFCNSTIFRKNNYFTLATFRDLENKEDIIKRINKVIRYIQQNLDKELLLEQLASEAHFSPFHFQRIFKNIVGESPKQLIKRIRLERAAHSIILNPELSILEVAFQVGFSSLEAFSRAFKNYYQISPDHFRKSTDSEKIEIIQKVIQNGFVLPEPEVFLPSVSNDLLLNDLNVEIVKKSHRKLIYFITNLASSAEISENFQKIKQWGYIRDIILPDASPFGLIMDYPLITALHQCNYQTCLEVTKQPELSGLVGYRELPASTYASFQTTGDIAEMIKKITFWFKHWLPKSGFIMAHQPALHLPLHDPLSISFTENTYHVLISIKPA
jgi:AraC family transcriptional regulator